VNKGKRYFQPGHANKRPLQAKSDAEGPPKGKRALSTEICLGFKMLVFTLTWNKIRYMLRKRFVMGRQGNSTISGWGKYRRNWKGGVRSGHN